MYGTDWTIDGKSVMCVMNQTVVSVFERQIHISIQTDRLRLMT